jgi:hypothetical protein
MLRRVVERSRLDVKWVEMVVIFKRWEGEGKAGRTLPLLNDALEPSFFSPSAAAEKSQRWARVSRISVNESWHIGDVEAGRERAIETVDPRRKIKQRSRFVIKI